MTDLLKKIFCKKRIPILIIFIVLTVIFVLMCTVLFPGKRNIDTRKESVATETQVHTKIPGSDAESVSDEKAADDSIIHEPPVPENSTDELYNEYTASFMQFRLQEANVYPVLGGSAAVSIKVPEDGVVYLSRFSGGAEVNYIGSSVDISGNIRSLELPESVTAVLSERSNSPERKGAFYGNMTLARFLPTEGLQYIGNNAFYGCRSLSDVYLPMSLSHIGDRSFYGCKSLRAISIFGECSVGDGAFAGCSSLTSVHLSDNVQRIGLGAFEHTPFYEGLTDEFCIIGGVLIKYNGKGGNVVIPDGVRIIGDGVFAGRLNIESVSFPVSVEYIGNSAFRSCTRLGEVGFAAGGVLPVIGEDAFGGCPVESGGVIAQLTVDARNEFLTDDVAATETIH